MIDNQNPRVAAIVVTYNRSGHLRNAMTAVLGEPFSHVIVVDNASTDGTPAVLAEFSGDSRVVVDRLATNTGGAGGFKRGCELAVALDVDWILLQDDDAAPERGFLNEFFAFLDRSADSDIGGVGAAVRSPGGVIVEMNRPSISPFRSVRDIAGALVHGRMALHVEDAVYDEEQHDVDCLSFVGYLVRRDLVVGELGLPRADFFIYADDQSYTYRVRSLGYRNVFVPSLRYVHDCSTYAATGVVSPMWKVYYLYRNSLEFYREIAGPWFLLVVPFKVLAWALRVRRYDAGQRRRYLRIARLGIGDGLRRRFGRSHDDVLVRAG